ncbi:dUTP diphosphatase [Bosea sp. 124]|uniref:dUTP diphosphatase n=1 Tax=Bosea sp. 124 TaxID=2135642 RepID=UPI000D3A4CA9|nr:dUTP diphosphatase [Bosea sp. 124]PTM40286.1 dUTP pyrophosphatase [Bosea sp. 124]
MVSVAFICLSHGADLPLPAYESAGAAGMDLRAALGPGETIALAPGARALVPSGLCLQVPEGFEAQVRPRSGLAAKHGVTVLNAPGTVDSDYRGEVKVILINHGQEPFAIHHGDRVAQLVVAPVTRATLVEVAGLDQTGRGAGGFGSTGVSDAGRGDQDTASGTVPAGAVA